MAAKETEKMTIEQVADALGVSKTTVSRALSGKGRISEETRAKVYAYMGRTRTEPAAPQGGEKVRTNNIAMIVPQRFITLDLPFLRKCMGGICIMADQRGYDLMLCYASNTEYSQLQRQLANHKVDGVILTYAMADDPCIELLRQYETPFVLIGRSEDKTIPQADNDQVAAACRDDTHPFAAGRQADRAAGGQYHLRRQHRPHTRLSAWIRGIWCASRPAARSFRCGICRADARCTGGCAGAEGGLHPLRR